MSTIEEFESAPIGATASSAETNARYVKSSDRWLLFDGRGDWRVDEYDLEAEGYTLTPAAPANSREAFDLTWELAHEVKEGQVIPEGMRYVRRYQSGDLATFISNESWTPRYLDKVRTQDSLPEPEPEWTKAPAVLARGKHWEAGHSLDVFTRSVDMWQLYGCDQLFHWSDLTDVTPLYPEGKKE